MRLHFLESYNNNQRGSIYFSILIFDKGKLVSGKSSTTFLLIKFRVWKISGDHKISKKILIKIFDFNIIICYFIFILSFFFAEDLSLLIVYTCKLYDFQLRLFIFYVTYFFEKIEYIKLKYFKIWRM